MSTKTVKIDAAGGEDLIRFAKEKLGMSFKDGTPVHIMRQKVKAAWGEDSFTLDAVEIEDASPRKAVKAEADHPEKVTVMISAHDGPGGDEPVPVSVNGRAMLIPRGIEAEIPWAYYQVLRNAVEARYEPVEGGGMSAARPVHRYPFSRVA